MHGVIGHTISKLFFTFIYQKIYFLHADGVQPIVFGGRHF